MRKTHIQENCNVQNGINFERNEGYLQLEDRLIIWFIVTSQTGIQLYI